MMWLFTEKGFYSAVQHDEDEEIIVVRSRLRGDMENILPLLGNPTILVNAGTDYAFRVYVPRTVWSKAVETMTNEIDYTNFKNAVHDGTSRDAAYMRVWSAMASLQR